jgi:transcription antitermination protein NusB
MPELPELPFDPANADVEIVEHETPENERSAARRIALQVLYEVDSAKHPPQEVVARHLSARDVERKTERVLRQLVYGVLTNRQPLDAVIQHYAPEWPLEQMAIVDRNILRMAIYEFVTHDNFPVGVMLDEAILLARMFGAENTPRFINGVLATMSESQETMRSLLGELSQPQIEDRTDNQ